MDFASVVVNTLIGMSPVNSQTSFSIHTFTSTIRNEVDKDLQAVHVYKRLHGMDPAYTAEICVKRCLESESY